MNQLSTTNVHVHSAYVAEQRLDALANCNMNSLKQKAAFDKQVLTSPTGHVVFQPGQLVQVYASEVDGNYKLSRKIIPCWSAPHRITSQWMNSCTLEMLEGFPMAGWFHMR
ncbi:hypothetical protein BDR05DRAFT_883501 [Suillus weaverae]|nr:hypothetical protein BDR05DRAFT_883501 [Suillus weaverae]